MNAQAIAQRHALASVPIVLLLLCGEAVAATIRVPDDYPTIQAGMDAASAGDTVVVACGTYYEHDVVVKSGICLTSASGGPECVTIDAGRLGRALYCGNASADTRIQGLTVRGGFVHQVELSGKSLQPHPESESGLQNRDAIERPWWEPYAGGGMLCSQGSPTISRVAFVANEADYGGGLCCHTGGYPKLIDVTFSGNSAPHSGGGMLCFYGTHVTLTRVSFEGNMAPHPGLYGFGGGLYGEDASLDLADVTFTSNAGNQGGGATLKGCSYLLTDVAFSDNEGGSRGGGIWCYEGEGELHDVVFSGNRAESYGGGLCSEASVISVNHATFTDNVVYGGSLCSWGGGMYCRPTRDFWVTYSTFEGNSAYNGGGIAVQSGEAHFGHLTLVGNGAHAGGSVLLTSTSVTEFRNCIIASSVDGGGLRSYLGSQPSVTLRCSDIYGNAGGDWEGWIAGQLGVRGNLRVDPLFCGEANPAQPYGLYSSSPCSPEYNPACGLIGAWGTACLPSATEATSWGIIKALFR